MDWNNQVVTHALTISAQIGVTQAWTSTLCGPTTICVGTQMFSWGKSLECKIIGCDILLERAVWQLQATKLWRTQVDMLQFWILSFGVAFGFTLQLKLRIPLTFSLTAAQIKKIKKRSPLSCNAKVWIERQKDSWHHRLSSINWVGLNKYTRDANEQFIH